MDQSTPILDNGRTKIKLISDSEMRRPIMIPVIYKTDNTKSNKQPEPTKLTLKTEDKQTNYMTVNSYKDRIIKTQNTNNENDW